MPNTTLTVPTLIQTVNISGKSEYHVRPLFSDSPVATHRRYAEALLKYKEELRRSFKKFPVSREKMEELGWFQFAPEIKLTHLSLQFDVGNHFIKGGFSVASFEVGGNVFGCLPSVNNFMFLVPKNERGKADVSATAEAVVQRLLKKIAKDSRDEFKAEHYFSPKKEVLTTVEQVVNVGQTQFDFEKDPMQFLFAHFRKSVEWDGGEEIQNVASDLLEQYPAMLRRAVLLDDQAERLFDLLFKNELAAVAAKNQAEKDEEAPPSNASGNAAKHQSRDFGTSSTSINHQSSPVVVIGKEGVGKHTLVEEVAWRYADNSGKGRDINKRSRLWHLNPNRVIAGMSIVGEWERRMEAILKYVRAPKGREDFPDKILIDNPVALLRIGKTSQTDLTLSRVLKPYLEKRQVQVILLATPEEWKIVQEADRSFADLFSVMRLQEPDLPTAIRIVLHNRRSLELENDCNITVPAISQLFTIHRNFLKNRALPGSVMKMLAQIAAKYRQRKVDAPEVREEFKATSGLEERIFDEETKLEKEEIRCSWRKARHCREHQGTHWREGKEEILMNDLEIAGLTLNSIRYRNLRSWLAILGIIIGVGSIISLISISVGLNEQIKGNLGGLGANIITISSGAARAEHVMLGGGGPIFGGRGSGEARITFREADQLRSVTGVSRLDARIQGQARVSFRSMNTSVSIIGTEPSTFPQSSGTYVSAGMALGSGDVSSAVLGYSVATDTFNESMLNKQIKINNVPFRVVGTLNKSGASFSGPDRSIFITQKAAKNLFNQTLKASSVVVIAANGSNPDEVAASLAEKLRQLHRVTEDKQDFQVTTATSLQSTISGIINTLGIFLGGIASISLIVGGIGVANAMFTSVLEQTKYIGLLKSLGARNSAVLKLFLFESCMVSVVGGLLGILLAFIASALMGNFGLPSKITPDLILLGLGFSIIVGAVSGLIPARNAASITPVEALRYE